MRSSPALEQTHTRQNDAETEVSAASPDDRVHGRRGSKWKGIDSLNCSLGKSACRGLRRKFDSPGTKVLGTRSTAEVALVTHSSPIFCTLPGAGSALQFLGSAAASMATMYDS